LRYLKLRVILQSIKKTLRLHKMSKIVLMKYYVLKTVLLDGFGRMGNLKMRVIRSNGT